MKNAPFSELSLEELSKKKKTIKGALIGSGVVMCVALTILLYLIFKNKNFVLLAVVPACLITFLPSVIGLAQINKEIKSRQSN